MVILEELRISQSSNGYPRDVSIDEIHESMHGASLVNSPSCSEQPSQPGRVDYKKRAWFRLTSDDCELETANDGIGLEIGHCGRSASSGFSREKDRTQ